MKRLAVASVLALSFTACIWLPRPRLLGPTDAERREYDGAIATARRDARQGSARLASFLERHPDSTLADDAVVPLARLEVKAGKSEQAEKRLRDVLRTHPKENRADAARLELAEDPHGARRARGGVEARPTHPALAAAATTSAATPTGCSPISPATAATPRRSSSGWHGCAPRRATTPRWPASIARSTR